MNLTTPQTVAYDVAYGLHSNIPECCVAFFIRDWDHESPYGQMIYHKCKCQYVPCPKCWQDKTFNKLRVCIKDCGEECRLRYRRLFS